VCEIGPVPVLVIDRGGVPVAVSARSTETSMRPVLSFASFAGSPPDRSSPVRAIIALALLGLSFLLVAVGTGSLRAETATEPLVIVTAKGPVTFAVEVMRTDEDRAKGLMFRRYMPEDRGMLFDFKEPQPVSMWMKNTYIPLDMVFIRKNGTIARIAEDTEPLSTRTIASGEEVLAVLELNGGAAQKAGIKAGDTVRHAMFKP
jgi:uncharacterized membrane protein (UPF0127 family)